MDMNNTSLQFYLDHEEETRLEREKFLRGEDVDLSIIPRPIYDSWVRSKALGVNPYVMNIPLKSKEVSVRNTEQFYQQYNPKLYQGLENFMDTFGFQIDITDRNGRLMTDLGPIGGYYCREDVIGTTSASIAYVDKRPMNCFGYQNYKAPFAQHFGVTYPVLDLKQDLIGMVTVNLPRPRPTQKQYETAVALLELMQFIFRQGYTSDNLVKGQLDLVKRALPVLSEGVILMDSKGEIKRTNESALRILGAKHSDAGESILEKLETLHKRNRADGSKKDERTEIIKHMNESGSIVVLKVPRNPSSSLRTASLGAAKFTFKDLLGEDRGFIRAKQEAFVVAPTDASVLIHGETGSGKELFAQAIHNGSLRKEGPFVAINCGAVPENLIESELFGYEPGSFTGASVSGKIGVLEAASNGTLFLDEVESMPLHVQIRLLRALSLGRINRLGGIREIPLNIRVVSATKTDLLKVGTAGGFREDLYFRLSTCRIMIPPLRERRGDIPILAKNFIEKEGKKLGFSDIKVRDSFVESLYYYDWKGNVRELENTIERAIIFMNPEEKILDRTLLYPELLENADQNQWKAQEALMAESKKASKLKNREEITIQEYIIRCDYNIKEAARQIGVSRQTLYRKIRASPALLKLIKESKRKKGQNEVDLVSEIK